MKLKADIKNTATERRPTTTEAKFRDRDNIGKSITSTGIIKVLFKGV